MGTIDLSKINLEPSKVSSSIVRSEPNNPLAFLNKEISLFGTRNLSDKKKGWFYTEMKMLFAAGIDMRTTLEMIEEEQETKSDKAIYKLIKDKVINGVSLSDALRESDRFSAYEYHSIRIGEQSGMLSEVLDELSKYYGKRIAQKRQIINALSYPIIVMITAIGAIFFMMNFIVPMFADIFSRSGGDLPTITQWIMEVSEMVSTYGLGTLGVLVATLIGLYTQRTRLWFRRWGYTLVSRIPLAGQIVQKIYLARFSYSMSLLLAAKTPLLEAMDLVGRMVSFYPIESSLTVVSDKVSKGMGLAESMSAHEIFNSRMISLIKVAEEVNQLDLIFTTLANQYNADVEHQTGLISSVLEPLIIIFLGAFVAVILIAMYLPLFQLSSAFGN